MKKILIYLITIVFFSSCIQDEIGNTNKEIFDAIWEELDKYYGGFLPRQINWDSIYQEYAPRINETLTERQLFELSVEMLDLLDDQHVFLNAETTLGSSFASGKVGDEIEAEKEFKLENVIGNYLEDDLFADDFGEDDIEYQFVFGKIKDKNIGYIYLPHFEESSNDWHKQIDNAIFELADTDGIIVDVRNNGGGFPIVDRYVARRFMKDENFIFSIQTRNGPLHSDFDEPTVYMSTPSSNAYTKPVVALINKSTVSAGEEFMLFMESQDHVTVLGSNTSNAFSGISFERFLPNGWRYGLPVQLYLYPDGTSPEGVGIIPDIFMKNKIVDVESGIDEILEEAISLI